MGDKSLLKEPKVRLVTLNTALAYILYAWCSGLHETTTGPLCLAERQTPRAVVLPGVFHLFLSYS